MKKTISALLCAGIFCYSIALSPWSVLAAENASDIPVVMMDKSSALYYEVQNSDGTTSLRLLPESQITGEIAITVYDYPIHVVITRQSSERPYVYYETDLAPQEGSNATEYVFLLDYSELPKNPSHFDQTYTADFLSGIYSSSYSIEISVPQNKGNAAYTESSMLIADYHTESDVTGKTRYQYTVSFAQKDVSPITVTENDAVITDGSATLDRQIQFLWSPYTLGDVDENGIINLSDVYTILTYYAQNCAMGSLPDDANFKAADVNGDETITIFDAFATLTYYAKASAGYKLTLEQIVEEMS